jgi:hypothetical protein
MRSVICTAHQILFEISNREECDGGAYSTYGWRGDIRKDFGKGPLRRPERKWEYNTKMYLHEVRWGNGLD